MVDLCDLCERYYVPISAKGSSSLKMVLPAILNGSKFLQAKYSQPIYGLAKDQGGIPSLNYKHEPQVWVRYADTKIIDPYELLPPVFSDYSNEDVESLDQFDLEKSISEGGSAMVAYRRLQFTDVPEEEKPAPDHGHDHM